MVRGDAGGFAVSGRARPGAPLSAAEKATLLLLSRGLKNEEIGRRLGGSKKTAEQAVARIRAKWDLPPATDVRHVVLRMQYDEIRELKAKLGEQAGL